MNNKIKTPSWRVRGEDVGDEAWDDAWEVRGLFLVPEFPSYFKIKTLKVQQVQKKAS